MTKSVSTGSKIPTLREMNQSFGRNRWIFWPIFSADTTAPQIKRCQEKSWHDLACLLSFENWKMYNYLTENTYFTHAQICPASIFLLHYGSSYQIFLEQGIIRGSMPLMSEDGRSPSSLSDEPNPNWNERGDPWLSNGGTHKPVPSAVFAL